MKKLLLPIIVLSLGIVSCGGKKKEKTSEDIVVADLKTACDCVGAMDIIANETVAIVDKFKTGEEIEADKEASDKLDKLETKLKDINHHCGKDLNIPKDEAEKCEGWAAFKTKMDKIEEKL